MSARRHTKYSSGASAEALAASSAPYVAAQARVAGGQMGDSTSQEALTRLNLALGELKALKVAPFLRRAASSLEASDFKRAAEFALKALHLDERSGLAWHILAIAREKVGDFRSAIQAYESALALTANQADIANDLGRLAYRMDMKPLAAQLFAHYRDANPDCVQGVNNMACVQRDLHDYAAAIETLRPAILANPESPMLWNTLGTVLSEQGDMATAITFFDEALRFDANHAHARYNRGNAKLDLGDSPGALADCQAALAIASSPSDRAMMALASSTILLCNGHIGEGWDAYEARFDPDFSDPTRFAIDRPRWRPDSELAGKALLVIGEQGLGDEVMFANILPDLTDAVGPDGRLTIALEYRLVSLFQRSFPTARVGSHVTHKVDGHTIRQMPFLTDPAAIDLWTPLASPLRRFRRSLADFPQRPNYLTADPARIEHWRRVLGELPGFKVGILWKSLKLDGARLRYFSPFEQWRPVLETEGATIVNLQYGECAAELANAREALGLEIWQPPGIDLKDDLDDVAALCCALDLVLGPPNATTNIASACGAKVWTISTPGSWPMLGSGRHPWYPQARVFAPERFNNWSPVMLEVAHALAEVV